MTMGAVVKLRAVWFFLTVAIALIVGAAIYVAPRPATDQSTFSFTDGEGISLSLADFHGRTILINFWATWCPPCREEMPSLDRLQAKLGSPRFEVVALSLDANGVDAVEPFFRGNDIENLAIYLDEHSAAMSDFELVGLPTTVLLGPDGGELERWVGPREWDSPTMVEVLRQFIPSDSDS